MQIGIGGVFQETNTYATQWLGPATIEHFRLYSGQEILDSFQGTGTEIGGALAAARAEGVGVSPLVFALATPGPTVAFDDYTELAQRLLDSLAEVGPLDALLLVLHGAGVVEGIGCLEVDLVRRIRGEVGDHLPIVATLDLHSALPLAATEVMDLVLPYHHYPHTDMEARGREALSATRRIVDSGQRPTWAMVHVPALVTAGGTSPGEPMAELLAVCQDIEARAGVIDASVHHGFPFADVVESGIHVSVAVAERESPNPLELAQELAGRVWSRRADLLRRPVGAADAVRRALEEVAKPGVGPVVINDFSDNPGGGAPGDSTHLLRALLEAGAQQTLVAALTCPELVRATHRAGVGAVLDADVGGRLGPYQGMPVSAPVRVKKLTDGVWRGSIEMGRGLECHMGDTALIEVAGIDVIICSEPTQVYDPEVVRIHGIDPSAYAIVVVKSSTHFRAGFADLAKAIVTATPPGLTSIDVAAFDRSLAVPVPYPIADPVGPPFSYSVSS